MFGRGVENLYLDLESKRVISVETKNVGFCFTTCRELWNKNRAINSTNQIENQNQLELGRCVIVCFTPIYHDYYFFIVSKINVVVAAVFRKCFVARSVI